MILQWASVVALASWNPTPLARLHCNRGVNPLFQTGLSIEFYLAETPFDMFTLVVVPGVGTVVWPGRFFAAAFDFLFAIFVFMRSESRVKKERKNTSLGLYGALQVFLGAGKAGTKTCVFPECSFSGNFAKPFLAHFLPNINLSTAIWPRAEPPNFTS